MMMGDGTSLSSTLWEGESAPAGFKDLMIIVVILEDDDEFDVMDK